MATMGRFFILIFTVGVLYAFGIYWNDIRGTLVPSKPVSGDIADSIDNNDSPLNAPEGFEISVFADNLPGARVMTFGPDGNMWVSQTKEGEISVLEIDDGKVVSVNLFMADLNRPHGLSFDPSNPNILYIAEEEKISRIDVSTTTSKKEKIIDLPSGKGHFTRTIAFGPDDRLYVSTGSSCNVCNEEEDMRAKIFSMEKDGGDLKEFARGLRNAVFFIWDDLGKMWATDNGRDFLGDDLPPDEVNIIEKEKNYGWPVCYGKNIHDTDFDKNTYIRPPCQEPFETESHIDIQAHSAPLGLSFVSEIGWPSEYHGNLMVAYHGSWNRSVPTGYKVVRFVLDEDGNYVSRENFITGWLSDDNDVFGRPVDILIGEDGSMYISDDKAGLIYVVKYKNG